MLPDDLRPVLEEALRKAGDSGPLTDFRRVAGGDINQAARITTPAARYFVKWHAAPPSRFFECEANGLRLLGSAGCVRVPQVISAGSVPGRTTAFLVLEWIEKDGGKSQRAAEALGRELASLHRLEQTGYGLDHDNYIGRLPQSNRRRGTWTAFYAEERLAAQRDQAARNGLLPAPRARRLDTLIGSLDRWIDESTCRPSLLHGDLWGGNWMVGTEDRPILIDPAVYVGDREADLAMTALFGGFPPAFYAAYNEVFPLTPGWDERQLLYQLYYLLCHLNLFGEGYGSSVDSILRRYTAG
jgi:fructosamine-3-kinase